MAREAVVGSIEKKSLERSSTLQRWTATVQQHEQRKDEAPASGGLPTNRILGRLWKQSGGGGPRQRGKQFAEVGHRLAWKGEQQWSRTPVQVSRRGGLFRIFSQRWLR